ncbi:hypothetical protein P153DRAFT_229403 [Dothidotthia symphoricarpi CBS 119687]|uniref:F-box domain-containing protein n=1 Tax=Dothidotthia symphoricarpi CBS 119687 TaxID=1392245 RepID=A0A6A6AHW3_9PLEO|nr:uncharacterized protein P153DRAFT_229403 [Dothidotthia symphoricarpi CBS 119687]KAF2130021.1 hypothetical protein P153DRAFT_229403 [Dothidotthia symphoricarpi CBS 119687]
MACQDQEQLSRMTGIEVQELRDWERRGIIASDQTPKATETAGEKGAVHGHYDKTHSPGPTSKKAVGILAMPDEILLNIVLSIDKDTTNLQHFALTHRRFRNVAHEALVRTGIVPLRSIPKYFVLVSQNPGWALHIKHIEFKDGSQPVKHVKARQATIDAGLKMIRAMDARYASKDMEEEFSSYTQPPLTWTYLLLASLPDLNSVSVTPNRYPLPVSYSELLTSPLNDSPLLDRLLDLFTPRLNTLEINTADPSYGPDQSATISLNHLYCLTSLTLPAVLISHSVLPANIETLRITADDIPVPWSWLRALHYMRYEDGCFPHLHKLQLLFSLPCRSLAYFVVYGVKTLRRWEDTEVLELLHEWGEGDVVFETLFFRRGLEGPSGVGEGKYEKACLAHAIRRVREETGRAIDFGV